MIFTYCTFPCYVNRLYPEYRRASSQSPDIETEDGGKKKVRLRGSA